MNAVGENFFQIPQRLIFLVIEGWDGFHHLFLLFRSFLLFRLFVGLLGQCKISFNAIVILQFRYLIDSAGNDEGKYFFVLVEQSSRYVEIDSLCEHIH